MIQKSGWAIPAGQNDARHGLGRIDFKTGWEAQFKAICEADPLPHVGCYTYGGSKINASPMQYKTIIGFERGFPSSSGILTDAATTCTWE